jgi:hypothetical protein
LDSVLDLLLSYLKLATVPKELRSVGSEEVIEGHLIEYIKSNPNFRVTFGFKNLDRFLVSMDDFQFGIIWVGSIVHSEVSYASLQLRERSYPFDPMLL